MLVANPQGESFDCEGDVVTKSIHGKVIKSEEIKFVHNPGKNIAEAGHRQSNGMISDRMNGKITNSDLASLKETFAKKIQIVELQAHEKGVLEGIPKGKELQKNETLETMQALSSLIHEITKLKTHVFETAEEQILQLVLAVTEKVIHMEVRMNRDVIQSVLKSAIRSIVDRENMKIRVHPLDFQYMMEIKSDFLQNFDGIRNIVFEEDDSILRGGAVIETLFGEVDARLDHQYEEVKSSMTLLNRDG